MNILFLTILTEKDKTCEFNCHYSSDILFCTGAKKEKFGQTLNDHDDFCKFLELSM